MLRFGIAATLLGGVSLAQTSTVSPDHFRKAEAIADVNLPFHRSYNRSRILQVHDDMKGQPMTVKSLSFRLDRATWNADVPAFSIIFDGACSTAATTANAVHPIFRKNHGKDRKQVISSRLFKFAKLHHSWDKKVFQYTVPFDKPFSFTGKAGLCWDLSILGTTNTYRFGRVDATRGGGHTNPPVYIRHFGNPCRTSKGSPPFTLSVDANSSSWPSGYASLRFRSVYAQHNQPVIVTLGASDKKLGAIKLPFLLPGSAASETGPCTVYSDIILAFVTLPKGTVLDLTLRLPLRKDFNGVHAYWQAYSSGVTKGSWPFVTSNAAAMEILAPYSSPPVGMVQIVNSSGSAGSTSKNSGAIVRFN